LFLRDFSAAGPEFRPLLESLLELNFEIGVLDGRRMFLNFREILETKPM
jgi:hypothetical protein